MGRRTHELADLLIREDVGRSAMPPLGDEPRGRNLRLWLGRAKPARESPDHRQTSRPSGMLHALRVHGPLHGPAYSDELGAFSLHVIDEVAECLRGLLILRAESTAQCHVFCQGFTKGIHCGSPEIGHGLATLRSALSETFA